ncbi:MAG: hypothetical protein ACOH13_12630 [Flavobacteriales bacterium]
MKTLLALHGELATATGLRATQLADRIAHVDAKVDGLVFGLYGLSEGEIGVVEGKL